MRLQVSVELRRPRWLRGRALVGLLGGLALLAGLAPATLLASHLFGDVPTSAFYHDAVSRIYNAGITGGCSASPPLYCPESAVTRGQMAVFLDKALGLGGTPAPGGNVDKLDGFHANEVGSRVARSTSLLTSSLSGTGVPVSQVTIAVPGGAATQFVEVRGQVTVYGELNSCPCFMRADLRQDGGPVAGAAFFHHLDLGTGISYQNTVGTQWVFQATPGTHTYQLLLGITTAGGQSASLASPVMIAVTHPFGSTGGSTLSVAGEAAPTGSDLTDTTAGD